MITESQAVTAISREVFHFLADSEREVGRPLTSDEIDHLGGAMMEGLEGGVMSTNFLAVDAVDDALPETWWQKFVNFITNTPNHPITGRFTSPGEMPHAHAVVGAGVHADPQQHDLEDEFEDAGEDEDDEDEESDEKYHDARTLRTLRGVVNFNPEGHNQYTGASGIHRAYEASAHHSDEAHADAHRAIDSASKGEIQEALGKMGFRSPPGASKPKLAEMAKGFLDARRGSMKRTGLLDQGGQGKITGNESDEEFEAVVNAWSDEARAAALAARQKMKEASATHEESKKQIEDLKAKHEGAKEAHGEGRESLKELHSQAREKRDEAIEKASGHLDEANSSIMDVHTTPFTEDRLHPDHLAFGKERDSFETDLSEHYNNHESMSHKERVEEVKSLKERAKALLEQNKGLKPEEDDEVGFNKDQLKENHENLGKVISSLKDAHKSSKEALGHARTMRDIRKIATNQERIERVYNREWPQGKRDNLDPQDFAGPDQSFPIQTQSDVESAAKLIGKAQNPDAVKARIKAIAKRKGLKLPEAWMSAITENCGGEMYPTQNDNPHSASKYAAGASMEHPSARDHAIEALDHSKAGDSKKAAKSHVAAAEAHEDLATQARKDKDPGQAREHDQYAADHRRAASEHSVAAEKAKLTSNSEGDSTMAKLTAEERKRHVDALITNCSCQAANVWTEEDRATLNAFSDEKLKNFVSQRAMLLKNAEEDDEKDEDDSELEPKESFGKKKKMAKNSATLQMTERMTPEELQVWNMAKEITEAHKGQLVQQLVGNISDAGEKARLTAVLNAKPVTELRDIIALRGPVANAAPQSPALSPLAIFLGAQGGPATNAAPVDNAADDLLDIPVMNFGPVAKTA